jgi:hypothetical protein
LLSLHLLLDAPRLSRSDRRLSKIVEVQPSLGRR